MSHARSSRRRRTLGTNDIFGNSSISTGRCLDLDTDATYLMEEWDVPAEVLPFATTEDGMHNRFVINYDHPDYPTGAILHPDTDPDGIMTQVTDSVTDFLTKLEPYDDSYAEGAKFSIVFARVSELLLDTYAVCELRLAP